jgi:hypothetical protein
MRRSNAGEDIRLVPCLVPSSRPRRRPASILRVASGPSDLKGLRKLILENPQWMLYERL